MQLKFSTLASKGRHLQVAPSPTRVRRSCTTQHRRCSHIVRAEEPEKPEKPESERKSQSKEESDKQVADAVEQLREQGVDSQIAQKILGAWQEKGITDASGVRGQFVKAGISILLTAGVQTLLDSIAAYTSFTTGGIIGSQDFTGAGLLGAAIDTLGWYFAIGVVFDLFSVGAVIASTAKLGMKTDQIYAAISALAGDKVGLGLVDKAQQAVSATKVVLALNSIVTALKMGVEGEKVSEATLDRLTALLILGDAEKKYGFSAAEKYNITQDEATQMASQFAKYDTNDDFKLEFSEFKALCTDQYFELDDKEAKAAMQMIDERNSGYIEFDEFAKWWVKSISTVSPSAKSSA